jgi:hypothetical protein
MSDRKPYVSALDRLRALPEVFDLRDIEVMTGWSQKAAIVSASRWRDSGLAASLGPRAGVYFNLVKEPDGPRNRLAEAVYKALRAPVVAIGATALHFHGWTTQRPKLFEIAVPVTAKLRSLPTFDGVNLVARNRHWFSAVAAAQEPGPGGFKVLKPEWALADAIGVRGTVVTGGKPWKPDADDIDLPDEDGLAERILDAARAMHADSDGLETLEEFLAEAGLEIPGETSGVRL